ncbi:MAG: hypothetical protein L6R36_005316 [Xanthoria steineri]|nr:MAG: hypothetical protein L6R36_005316 [Xanthoria steineri]
MALDLAKAAPLKPEIKLDQALVDYERVLSDDEKAQLRAEGAPDTMAAIAFTAVIDKECSKSRRRCMGPRLITFLESVQQFSGVIDTFVSSHPEFAALHAFDHEFGPFEREITKCCQEVKDEAALASKQAQKHESDLQAQERAEAGEHRRFAVQWFSKNDTEERKWRMDLDRRRRNELKIQALDSLSTYDHWRTYKQHRKEWIPGTSEWILENSKFKRWKEGTSKGFWCSGKVGSGKSVTSACVISHLIESRRPTDVTTFFFCRFDDQESLKATTIIGSIARQLVNDSPEDRFRDFSRRTPIVEFLKNTLSDTRQYFIILDGLDECNEEQIRETCGMLHGLLSLPHLHIKLFWCSRPNVMDWLPPRLQSQQHINLESVESQGHIASDIGKLIHSRLEEWLDGDSPQLRIGDPTLPLTIVQCLENEAQGMFLWVKLQLHTLSEKRSDQQIIDALSHLPRDLPQTYERILAQFTEAEDIDLGSQIFRWVAVAKRPLTVQELREAIGIVPLQDAWNPRSFMNDMKKAMACCGNLLFVDEEQQTVHFTHSSVLQYLRSDVISKFLGQYFIDLKKADADAGATCVTYLNLPIFNTQLARKPKVDFNTTAVTSTIVKNSLPAGKSANWLALHILRRQDKSGKSVQRLLEETAGDDELSRRNAILEQHVFFPYAQKFWLEHTRHGVMAKSAKFLRLFCNLLDDSHWRGTLSGIPWTFEDWENRSTNVIEWIAENNHTLLAELLIDSERDLTLENLQVLIEDAARRGHAELVEVCLGSQNISQMALLSALGLAASSGNLMVVERLLQEKVDVTAIRALELAAEHGHLSIVERLLKETSDVERLLQEKVDVTAIRALELAAEHGHLSIVERLLKETSDVTATEALSFAAGEGHLAIVERLLQEGADINATDSPGHWTALHSAAYSGYLAIVEQLLQEGADVNTTNRSKDTALHYAAGRGHLAIVEKLLQRGAEVDGRGRDVETPLHYAAGRGHLAIVEELLQEGANIDATDRYGLTAHYHAARNGHQDVAERLEAAGGKK